MTIKEFKENWEYWIGCGEDYYATGPDDADEVSELIKIIKLIEEDVIVKGDDIESHYVKDISLNGIINALSQGYEVICVKDI